ncbi:hypothetical protein LMG24235_05317 [Paraburkholderia sabiae]|nr:hypothetical protein LMG24235_05317 [Paraburkholderia sabiae]
MTSYGSMTSAHASVGAAATWPTTGTIFSPADAIRHGAAASPQPLNDVIIAIAAVSSATRRTNPLSFCLAFTLTAPCRLLRCAALLISPTPA